jgi:hypothetical protein
VLLYMEDNTMNNEFDNLYPNVSGLGINHQLEEVSRNVEKLIYTIIENKSLLQGHWHLGEVTQVVNDKRIRVKIDGSETDQEVGCNPDVVFNVGDHVYVHFVNGSVLDKFVPYKRAVL